MIFRYKNWRILRRNLPRETYKQLFDKIQQNDYEIVDILKEHHRSNVYRIKISGKDLVLKIPLEKNKGKWIRFLTLIRQGEAFKNLRGMMKLEMAGIKTTIPIMAAERRSFGMVVDSWVLYEYLDAQSCLDRENTYPQVVAKLREIHSKGLLHGDAQIRNFVTIDDEIFVIDSNPKSAGIIKFSKTYEFAYLKRSAPGIEDYFGDYLKSKAYRFTVWYDQFDRKLARLRRRLKALIGLKRT